MYCIMQFEWIMKLKLKLGPEPGQSDDSSTSQIPRLQLWNPEYRSFFSLPPSTRTPSLRWPSCKFSRLTGPLTNHTGVQPASLRALVYTPWVGPWPLHHWSLPNYSNIASRDCLAQHINMWREFTKPGYEGFSISLGLMRTLIHSSDEYLWQTPSDVYPSLSLTTQYSWVTAQSTQCRCTHSCWIRKLCCS